MSKPLFVSHLEFDHCFTDDRNHRFLHTLERLGFTLMPKPTLHPQGAVCRFIAVDEASRGRKRSYFEFVHLTTGRYEGLGGLSFRAVTSLDAYFQTVRRKKALGANLDHRNYDWMKGEDERRPGWNFVMFHEKTPRKLFVWLTENEPTKERPLIRKPTKHKIGATRVKGLHIELAERDRPFFTALFGRSFKDSVELNCGTLIQFSPAASTKLKEVVLALRDLDRINRAPHKYALRSFRDQPALAIQNPDPKMWDILLVQEQAKRR